MWNKGTLMFSFSWVVHSWHKNRNYSAICNSSSKHTFQLWTGI